MRKFHIFLFLVWPSVVGCYLSKMCAGPALDTWGLNSYRQLGFSDQVPRYSPATLPLPNNEQIHCVVLGGFHSAVQTVTGQWYSFGRNDQAQLGLNHATFTTSPMPIPDVNGSPVVDVVLGNQYSFLKTANGIWYGVGYNDPGMLGLNYTVSRVVTPAAVLLPSGVTVAKMVTAWYTAGLIGADGSLYIWGDGTYGQIGNNSSRTIPWTTPQLVSLTNVTLLALGIYHSLAVTGCGRYYVWGLNRAGQLGTGDLNMRLSPTLLTPPNGRTVIDVITGYMTVAFLTDDGTWYMTGQNQYGQLGNTSLGSFVATPTKFPLVGVLRMAAGQNHWMGVTESGDWYVWGYNYDGELGLGTTNDVSFPHILNASRGETIFSIILGDFHCAALRTATLTPTLTPTSSPVQCPGAKEFTTGTLTVALSTPCHSVFHGPSSSGNVGSDSLFDRYLMVYVHTVPSGSTLEVELTTGCTETSCLVTFTSSSAETTTYVPVGSTSQVLLAVSLHSLSASATSASASVRSSAASGASAELSIAYKGSTLLLGLTSALTALAMLLVCGGIWWKCWMRRERSETRLRRNNFAQEMTETISSSLLAFGAWCLIVGILWIVIGVLTTKPLAMMPALFITGACLVGIGSVLIAGCGLYLLLDPVTAKCPECNEPVSRWKFRGTYVLARDGGDAPFSKAHTNHVRCQLCKRPVVQDRWPASAPCRPYHRDCWETFCSKAVMDSNYFNTWWENSQSQASKVELVHMLAMAITTKEMAAVERFAQLDPKLIFTPIFSSGMRTPVQLAALFGHRDIVELLLQRGQQRTLDASCPVDPLAPKSMRIYGLDKEDNDLYLYQPQLLYNDQPVFVGHTFGKYIYYYEPSPDPGERQFAVGWCLSPHLGSGACRYRLKLDEAISTKVVPKSSVGKMSQVGSQGSLLHRMKTWLLQKGNKRGGVSEVEGTKEKDPLMSGDDSTYSGSIRPPTPATTVPTEKLIDVQVDWVSHATSLIEDAIVSGNQSTIEFVLQLYHRQDPGCLVWHYRTKQRLWEVYPTSDQREIRDAIATGLTEAVLTNGGDTRVLSFEEMEQRCEEGRRPIKYTMRAIIQFTRKGVTVSSDVDSVWEWENSCIIFSPTHAAAAAQDERTLTFLLEEGVVDHTLWAPPCHNVGAWRILSDDHGPVLDNAMTEELSLALGTPAGMFPRALSSLLGTHNTVPLPKRAGENRLTDGLNVAPQDDAQVTFYDPSYTSDTWVLPFCMSLSKNTLGLVFNEDVILQMLLDALKKGHELQRQWFLQPLRHALALFVYTYELSSSGLTDQIYSCMNRAMRLRDPKLITFWRPLIWEIDQALQAFPAIPTKSFRGINCQMDPAIYKAGGHICWPSFSSASQSRSVAEEFAKGESGTLFFLQGTTPRHIARVSRYPDEDEVLFGPNSVFEVTTTLQQTSDIGQFYGKVDNIAMKQIGGSMVPGLKPRPLGYTSVLVHLPPFLCPQLIGCLSRMQNAGIQSVDLIEERSDGISAHIVLGDGPGGSIVRNQLSSSSSSVLTPSKLDRLLHSILGEDVPDPLPTNTRVTLSDTTLL